MTVGGDVGVIQRQNVGMLREPDHGGVFPMELGGNATVQCLIAALYRHWMSGRM